MLKIHGIARSRAFRCIWAAEEAGVPYEIIPVGFGPGLKDAIASVNPNGKVPTLTVDGAPMFEALAIAIWLGEH